MVVGLESISGSWVLDSSKNKSNDRILVLQAMEGKATLSTTGTVDKRLFSGENKLHCIYEEETGLWYFKMDHGFLPGGLTQRFTTYGKALAFAREYYARRNIEIKQTIE